MESFVVATRELPAAAADVEHMAFAIGLTRDSRIWAAVGRRSFDLVILALVVPAALPLAACSDTARSSGKQLSSGGADESGGDGDGLDDEGADGATDDGDDGARFDVGHGDGDSDGDGGTGATCEVTEIDAVPECTAESPPDSWDGVVEWSWWGEPPYTQSVVTPLVANLTDDDGNGSVDLCDVPDVLVTVRSDDVDQSDFEYAALFLLDGATGAVHWKTEGVVWGAVTPAIGDLDGDGVAEIVTVKTPTTPAERYGDKPLIAFDSDGKKLWEGDAVGPFTCELTCAVSLADLDNDGSPEILVGERIFDASGHLVRALPDENELISSWANLFTIAVDLDGDEDLEVVLGRSAYHHDGTEVFKRDELAQGSAHVADMDDDGQPEILLFNGYGFSLLEADGTPIYTDQRPTGDMAGLAQWVRPAMIHDIDGDGTPEISASTSDKYVVYAADGTVRWTAAIDDATGAAGSTAFDFLGDGTAEAMYADHGSVYVFGEQGNVLLQSDRSSRTLYEYPVVVDVDNDGSSEIVHVSSKGFDGVQTGPTVQVVGDSENRWIQARRIWNQHAYFVTNVREDGTIPQFQRPHWETTNTFRTQAQIEAGGVCTPPRPAG